LRAVLANVLRACGVRLGPSRSSALGPLCVGAGLIADSLEFGDAVPERRVREIGNPVLNRVVESLELGVRFGRSLAQCGSVCRLPLGPLAAAVEHEDRICSRRAGLQVGRRLGKGRYAMLITGLRFKSEAPGTA
jgi:hypothetical protein